MTKTFEEIVTNVESPQFDAVMNSISGIKQFKLALDENQDIQALINHATDKKSTAESLFSRLVEHLNTEHDKAFGHPNDVVIATYYYALANSQPEIASKAKDILSNYPNLFWARYLVNNLDFMANVADSEY